MPNTSTPSIIREVAIGRRIKGSEMLIGDRLPTEVYRERGRKGRRGSARRARLWHCGLYTDALGQPILPVDDDPPPSRQALRYHRDAVLDRTNIDDASLDSIVGLDDIRVVAIGPLLDGLRRYRSGILAHRQNDTHTDKCAGPQTLLFIVETRLQVNSPRRLID